MESGEGRKENAEIKWEKLWKKKGGNSTPAASFWRANVNQLDLSARLHHNVGLISSRKLAAALWELHHYKPPLDDMRRRPPPPPPTSSKLPESSSNLRRRVADLLMQHHRSIETSNHATQTVSPSICSSSMEIAPCYPGTPSSSVELNGESKTSTKLLKVLNRVWILEEQHASNVSLIKALKKELDRARFQPKELSREQQCEPMECLTGGTLLKTNKANVQSTRDELEQGRKLRNHSESLQRELAQELHEVKRSVARISKELEKERASRGFLEELCDELAWGVRDCERELHDQRQKSDTYLGESERDDHGRLILRIAQAWLDERMQVKQQHRKTSVESMPSARLEEDDGDGSSSSQSTCFEVEKTSKRSFKPQGQKLLENHFEKMLRIEEFKEKLESSDRTRASNPSRLQAKFEEHMAQAMSDSTSKRINKDLVTASSLRRSSQCPVRGWTEKLPAQASETPLKLLSELKELSEARSGGSKVTLTPRSSDLPFKR